MHPILKSYINYPTDHSIAQLLIGYDISDHDLFMLKMLSGKDCNLFQNNEHILLWKDETTYIIIRLLGNRCILYKSLMF